MDENFNNGYNNPQENNNQDYAQHYNQQYDRQNNQLNNQQYGQQNNQQYSQPNSQFSNQQNGQPYNQPYNHQNGNNQNYSHQYGQPQQYNAPYYNAQYPEYRENNNSNGFAIASLVLGLISIVCCFTSFSGCCFWLIALPASIVGLILGIVSLKKGEQGKGMAIAGVVTSGVSIAYCILLIFIAIMYSVSYINYYGL